MKTGVVLQRVLLGIINSNVNEWIGIANVFIVGTFSWVLCKGRGFEFLNCEPPLPPKVEVMGVQIFPIKRTGLVK